MTTNVPQVCKLIVRSCIISHSRFAWVQAVYRLSVQSPLSLVGAIRASLRRCEPDPLRPAEAGRTDGAKLLCTDDRSRIAPTAKSVRTDNRNERRTTLDGIRSTL
jgi:hypothetical protein